MTRRFNTAATTPAGRRFAQAGAEIGAADGRKVSGYALKWGVPSLPLADGSRVVLAKDSAVLFPEVLALYDHDYGTALATTADKSLVLMHDDVGLKVEASLPDTPLGRHIYGFVRDGRANGMSFGMWDWQSTFDPATKVETITRFSLDEVTITDRPRFPQTSINAAQAQRFSLHRRQRADFSRHLLGALRV